MNKNKRKEKIMSSIDSIHITVKGDASGREINGIFDHFTKQPKGEEHQIPEFIKVAYNPKIHERSNPRGTHFIKFKNDLTIKCSSTGGKGKQLHDKVIGRDADGIETIALDSGGLVYEIGGISSYNYKHVLDSWCLPKFVEVLRQIWDYNMEFSEMHFAFDILEKVDNLLLLPLVPHTKELPFMNTQYFNIELSSGGVVQVRIYDKSLKDMTYLDVVRIELVCKRNFFEKLGSPILLMAKNEKEIRESASIIAKELRLFFEESLNVFLPNGNQLIPNENDILEQIVLITRQVRGIKEPRKNKYNPLQHFCQEQHNLMEGSWKLNTYIKNMEAITNLKLVEMLLTSKLPATRAGIEIISDGKKKTISLSTVKKMRTFLESRKPKIIADKIQKELSTLGKNHISEVTKIANKNFENGTPYLITMELACISCNELLPEIVRVYRKYLPPSLSSMKENQDKSEIASILFQKHITTIDEQGLQREAGLMIKKLIKRTEFRIKTIIKMKEDKKKISKKTITPALHSTGSNDSMNEETSPPWESPEGTNPLENADVESSLNLKDINYHQRKVERAKEDKRKEEEKKKKLFNDGIINNII